MLSVVVGAAGVGFVLVIVIIALRLRSRKEPVSTPETETAEATTLADERTVVRQQSKLLTPPVVVDELTESGAVMSSTETPAEAASDPRIPTSFEDEVIDEDLAQALVDLEGSLELPAEIPIENRDPIPHPLKHEAPKPVVSDAEREARRRKAQELAANVRIMLESSTFTDIEALKSFLRDQKTST